MTQTFFGTCSRAVPIKEPTLLIALKVVARSKQPGDGVIQSAAPIRGCEGQVDMLNLETGSAFDACGTKMPVANRWLMMVGVNVLVPLLSASIIKRAMT